MGAETKKALFCSNYIAYNIHVETVGCCWVLRCHNCSMNLSRALIQFTAQHGCYLSSSLLGESREKKILPIVFYSKSSHLVRTGPWSKKKKKSEVWFQEHSRADMSDSWGQITALLPALCTPRTTICSFVCLDATYSLHTICVLKVDSLSSRIQKHAWTVWSLGGAMTLNKFKTLNVSYIDIFRVFVITIKGLRALHGSPTVITWC